MFKFSEICELVQLVGTTGVASVEVEHGGSRMRIEGPAPTAAVAAPPAGPPPAAAAPAQPAPAQAAAGEAAADDDVHAVTSPIVGTFYRAPNPDADSYVKVGDAVEAGQTLCIVEAMKLMNEIECDVSGTVVKVLPENAQAVEYGEQLFLIRLG